MVGSSTYLLLTRKTCRPLHEDHLHTLMSISFVAFGWSVVETVEIFVVSCVKVVVLRVRSNMAESTSSFQFGFDK